MIGFLALILGNVHSETAGEFGLFSTLTKILNGIIIVDFFFDMHLKLTGTGPIHRKSWLLSIAATPQQPK